MVHGGGKAIKNVIVPRVKKTPLCCVGGGESISRGGIASPEVEREGWQWAKMGRIEGGAVPSFNKGYCFWG